MCYTWLSILRIKWQPHLWFCRSPALAWEKTNKHQHTWEFLTNTADCWKVGDQLVPGQGANQRGSSIQKGRSKRSLRVLQGALTVTPKGLVIISLVPISLHKGHGCLSFSCDKYYIPFACVIMKQIAVCWKNTSSPEFRKKMIKSIQLQGSPFPDRYPCLLNFWILRYVI